MLVVQNLNPDGFVRGVRQNGRGVDLNRNFGSEWRRIGRRWSPQHAGPRPWSEPETRLARRLVERLRPNVTIWFHQPQALVRAWGPSIGVARVYARLAGMPYRSLRWPNGTAPNWQNHRFPDDAAFVVELPAGPLPAGRTSARTWARSSAFGVRSSAPARLRRFPVRGEGAVARRPPRVHWHRSSTLGTPSAGRLERGVVLPSWGADHVTWDPVLRGSPGRVWRRVGSDRLVRLVLAVATAFRREHPDAPRLLVGDLSRPRGGDFGPRFGGLGHVSHQNGLDVDVYYPRRDGIERPPVRPGQVDLRRAQWLVDRFVAAGAVRVFVGPSLPLRGPAPVVAPLPRHDNHLHVRIAAQ